MILMLVLMGLLFSLFYSAGGKKIKYDRRTIKILLVTTIVSALLFLTGLVCMLAQVEGDAVIALSVLLGLYVGGGLFLFAGVNLLSGFCM